MDMVRSVRALISTLLLLTDSTAPCVHETWGYPQALQRKK
jgi:hypothetical protein